MQLFRIVIILILSIAVTARADLNPTRLKSGFVYLDVLDPSIRVDIRYSTNDNLTGRPLPGMGSGRAVLTREAAMALVEVQEELILHGYTLVVYNAYMPLKAYKTLEEWVLSDEFKETQDKYCPNYSGPEVIETGYVPDKYAHVRGSTVSVTMIPIHDRIKHTHSYRNKTIKGSKAKFVYVDDGTVNMGTSYDFLDPVSCHSFGGLHEDAMINRQLLREMMENHGFKASDKVWWQYTYQREPFVDSEFNFDI